MDNLTFFDKEYLFGNSICSAFKKGILMYPEGSKAFKKPKYLLQD